MPFSLVHAATAEESFRLGVAAVRGGDIEQAVVHFEAARDAGLDTGALHFNLAVAYYRSGRIGVAEQSFLRAADSERMAAPALYQLGRLARAGGDETAALDYFRRAAEEARTEVLREAALAASRRLPAERPPKFVYVGLGGGHDSNISLTPSDASGSSEESRFFLEGILVVREPLDTRNYLRGSGYLQGFSEGDDFDLAILSGGIGRIGRLGGVWRWDAWIDGRHRRLDAHTFDNALLPGVEFSRPLGGGWRSGIEYGLELVRGGDDFGFVDGIGHQLELRLDERGRAGWDLAAGLAVVDRDDRETTDDFFSFSWTGILLRAEYAMALGDRRYIEFRADRAHREYDGTEVRDGNRLGSREENMTGVGIAYDRPLAADWSLRAAIRLERRDANLGEFDYERQLFRLTLDRVF